MKKKLLVIMLAFCLVVLSGCGATDVLRLKQTTLSASDFYCVAMKECQGIIDVGDAELYSRHQNDQTYQSFQSVINNSTNGQVMLATVIAMMDFATFVVESETATTETSRIYEYKFSNSTPDSIIVFVSKVKNKQIYNCKTYVEEFTPESFSDVLDGEPDLTHSFNVDVDKDSGVYEFSDSDNGTDGTFYYNKYEGEMSVMVQTILYSEEQVVGVLALSYNFCNYKHGVGGRGLITYSSEDATQKYIQEFYSKDFYKKAKFGLVKNEQLYLDMEKTTEQEIASKNDGDARGFTVLYNNTDDAVTIVAAY